LFDFGLKNKEATQMATTAFDSTTAVFSAEPSARDIYRAARNSLKQDVKTDAVEIRAAKRVLREVQRAGGGSREMFLLHHQRADARARLALYAFLRGRTWAQFEPIHAEECKISLRISSLWKKLAAAYPGLEAPDALRAVCPAKWFEVKA
jgi:hypothetical protein